MPVYDLEPIEESPSQQSEKENQASVADRLAHVESGPTFEQKSEVAKENSYEKILERVQSQSSPRQVTQVTASVHDDATSVSSLDEESRIQKLVNIALEKGPDHAIRVAVKLDDMYALDMLHDRLSHQLYEELVQKGLLKSL